MGTLPAGVRAEPGGRSRRLERDLAGLAGNSAAAFGRRNATMVNRAVRSPNSGSTRNQLNESFAPCASV